MAEVGDCTAEQAASALSSMLQTAFRNNKSIKLTEMILPEAVPGGRGAGSLAWAGLGNTYFWIDPAKGIAGVILMQLIPFADPKALALLDSFERALHAALG
jgi:CubicO group peptidase (beta-lactamase class C family)